MMKRSVSGTVSMLLAALLCHACANAKRRAALDAAAAAGAPYATGERTEPVPAGYVIGPEDLLSIVFWRDKDLSVDVTVRPDGRISLPLLNEFEAAGLTTEQLREELTPAADSCSRIPTSRSSSNRSTAAACSSPVWSTSPARIRSCRRQALFS